MSGVGPGDELLGLTRAVLGAGAGGAGRQPLGRQRRHRAGLHEHVLRRAGLRHGRAASLQAAALETRRRDPHPYFWAPFILVGAP